MGVANLICRKKVRLHTLLYHLLNFEYCAWQEQIPYSSTGRVFQSFRRSTPTLHIKRQFWILANTQIDGCNHYKTTFKSYHLLYRFLQLPVFLKNASSTVRVAMNKLGFIVRLQLALVYLDGIVILSRYSYEPWYHTYSSSPYFGSQRVLGASVSLKSNKYLFEDFADHLKHVIPPGKLVISMEATKVICGLEHLRNVTR